MRACTIIICVCACICECTCNYSEYVFSLYIFDTQLLSPAGYGSRSISEWSTASLNSEFSFF